MRRLAALLALVALVLGGAAASRFAGSVHATTIGEPIVAGTPNATPGIPTNPDPRDRVPNPDGPITPKPIQGIPSIVPTRLDAPVGEATFGAAAASAQALKEQPWQFNFTANGLLAVASVEFPTGAQLNESSVGGGVQFAPDRLFCLVTITGDFTQPAPAPGSSGPLGKPMQPRAVYVLYDARTGNYLGMGGLK